MGNRTHAYDQDYPEQPYISPDRDITAWETSPEQFPYGKVEKRQMKRLPEGVLPGDIIMLWRIQFGNFTNETVIPPNFEYRYGVDSMQSIQTLLRLGFAELCTAKESLDMLTVPVLRKILQKNGMESKGKKAELVQRLRDELLEVTLATELSLRKYRMTPQGGAVLEKYSDIIQRHGSKA